MLNYPIDDESAEEIVAQQSGNIGESELAVIDSAILSPDEQDNCPAGYFHCNTTAQCVPQRANCDGSVDCDDTSDEWNCVNDVDAKYWDHLFRKNPYGRQGMDDKPIGECSEYAKRRRRRGGERSKQLGHLVAPAQVPPDPLRLCLLAFQCAFCM